MTLPARKGTEPVATRPAGILEFHCRCIWCAAIGDDEGKPHGEGRGGTVLGEDACPQNSLLLSARLTEYDVGKQSRHVGRENTFFLTFRNDI